MASPITYKDAEYQYYMTKLTGAGITPPGNTPLTELRKVWHAHVVGSANNQLTAADLELKWLQTLTGVTGKTVRDCWEQAFVGSAKGLRVPSTLEELKAIYFQQVLQ